MYKCEKGEKQYKMCKEASADYCSDCPHGMKENSIEEDIKIALDKFSDNKDSNSAVLIVEQFILGNYVLVGGRKNIVKNSLRYILSDYKRVLKENEELKKSKITYEKVRDIQEKNRNIVDNKYIPTQKIKEIIDRIDYDIEKTKEIISKNTNVHATYQIVRLRAMNTKSLDIKKRLKKLLESEK